MNGSEENRSIYGTEQLSWIGKYGELKKTQLRQQRTNRKILRNSILQHKNCSHATFQWFHRILSHCRWLYSCAYILRYSAISIARLRQCDMNTHTHTFTLFKHIRFRKKFQEIERKTTLKKIKLNSIKVIFALNLENDAHTHTHGEWECGKRAFDVW